MIILNKKRILFIIFTVMVAVCIPAVQENKENSIETMALSVSNKVIIIDAGHRRTR